MKNIKWTKDKCYKENKYVLSSFPFFDVEIVGSDFGPWRLGYMFRHNNSYNNMVFNNLEDAKKYVLKELYKVLSKVDLDKVKTIEELDKIKYVSVSYDTWCNNNGDGKYLNNGLYEKYHWIEGRFLNTTRTAHNYAIRYDRAIDEYSVKRHAVIIVKRHIKRFLDQYNKN